MRVAFVLSCMENSGYPFPKYIEESGIKVASITESDPNPSAITSQQDVWMSHVKLACDETNMRPLTRQILQKRVKDAAFRFGILDDLDQADQFIEQVRNRQPGIESREDFQKAAEWVFENAGSMDPDTRAAVVDELRKSAVKVGHVLTPAEDYSLNKIAGEELPERLLDYARHQVVKLATGSSYAKEQFRCLTPGEVREALPDLMKAASFEMDAISTDLFARESAKLPEGQAWVLDALMDKHGQVPIDHASNHPVQINDEILALM